jgi:serine/threonine protein kinase
LEARGEYGKWFRSARDGPALIIVVALALTPGTRLGPYEIVASLGVGGMGEVYRATDTNLKRAAAIKVLPASVSSSSLPLGQAAWGEPLILNWNPEGRR